MNPPPWAYRPDLRRSEFAEEADLADIFARALRSVGRPARRAGRAGDPTGWTIAEDEVWVVAGPTGESRRDQGWKLHLSATVHSARTVLSRVLPILLRRRCHFKFARSLRQLEILNGIGCPEGLSGKFLTVYPEDDAAAVELARRLDEVTAGLDGPRILSDRALRPGSLVHVRYGAFQDRSVFTPYGVLQSVIAGPDGTLVEDRRLGRFTPPTWAPDPFLAASPVATPRHRLAAAGGDALLIGDYRIEAALKRANRGGTYRGRSLASGQEVVVKEARPHVATDRFGRDARDRLRHEHAILTLIDRSMAECAPRPLDLFERGGHLFLVREYLPGLTLRTVVRRRLTAGEAMPPADELRSTVRALAGLLERFHTAGLVVRDLNPNNLLQLSGEAAAPRFAMVDLELAFDPSGSTPPFRGATLAYASPQQEDDLVPTFADDVYSLGATLTFVATGADPFFLADSPLGRSRLDKIEERLALHRVPTWAADPILRCLSPDPADRPTAAELVTAATPPTRTARSARRLPEPPLPTDAQLLDAVDGAVAYLAAARADGGAGRLWPATAFGSATDPLNVGHGASGVGLFLLQSLRTGRDGPAADLLDRIVAATDGVAPTRDNQPIGLYYGRAGIAWFLADAGEVLGRPDLIRRSTALLRSLPTAGEAPEVMTGTAGLLLAAVRLYRATGDPTHLARIEAGAEALAIAAEWTPRGPVWPIPAHFAVDLVGKTYPGFAYGLAGIAYALLCASAVTGQAESADLAAAALCGLVSWRQERDGRRWWPTSSRATAGSPCWLKGAAGIGAGLVRAARLTGEPVYREAALDCWRMVRPAPRHGPLTQLNGLAGVGEFCLDLADLLGVEEARPDARQIARTIYAHRVDRRSDGYGISFPDEDGLVGADLLTGVTGIASFLLRLASGTPRLLMLDDLLKRDTPPEDGS